MSNKLDQFYRRLVLSKYFTKGWGKPENLKRICEFRKIVSNRESCFKLVPPNYPVYIERVSDHRDYSSFDGYFITPFAQYLPEVVPVECYKAYFQLILPKKWQDENYKPVILQIAGTGDQYYWRRRNLIAKPLIKEAGIGSIILENPFYGRRKPLEQRRTILHNVSDIFVMGGCLILESLVLFHFCERLGYGPLGVTGLSMGGHVVLHFNVELLTEFSTNNFFFSPTEKMASLAATCWPKPLIVVPCLSGLTASSVFTQGVISGALNWDMLEEQFHSDSSFKEEMMKMIDINQGDAFKAGQQFAKHLSFKPHLKYFDPAVGTSDSNFCGNNSKGFFDFHFTSSSSLETMKTGKRSSTAENLSFALLRTNDCKSDMLFLRKMMEKNAKKKESPDSEFSFSTSSTNLQHLFDSSCDEEKFPSKSLHERFDNMYSSKMKASHSKSIFKSFSSLSNLSSLLTSANFQNKTKENDATYFDIELIEPQASDFMNGIMDECTHLKNYSTPVDTSLVIAVCADDDAYVPLKGMSKLNEVWPGAEVRYVKGGHVRAYIQCQRKFRLAIIDAFSRYRSKYAIST